MRNKVLAALLLLSAFGGCRKKPVDNPDYEGTRRHAEEEHQSLDQQRVP